MIQQETLSNGVRFVVESMPSVRSCSLGIFVGVGSRYESKEQSGAAHFIEHMLFKGTPTRTAAQLAEESDFIGGQLNAYTTKESTCFYVRCLDEHLDKAMDLLFDLFLFPSMDEADVLTERGVILEEIGMYEDTPDDLVAERLSAAVFQGSPLARPILGTRTTLEGMTGASLRAFKQEHYRGGDIVVSLAGSFTQAQLDTLRGYLAQIPAGKNPVPKAAKRRTAVSVKRRAIEQNHLTIAFPGLEFNHEERYALQVLSTILGGGTSSRLFQRVREDQGLCYTIYSYGASHADTGLFCIYTATGKQTEEQARACIREVIERFRADGPTQQEVLRAREQSKANVLMGMESTQARMSHMGRSTLFANHIQTTQEIAQAYDAVTQEQVQQLAQRIFDWEQASLSAVGRVDGKEQYEAFLRG